MIKTININGANRSEISVRTRIGCRGVVIKDGKMLVSHEINADYFLIPGGGLEKNETTEECCIREVREETGYIVKPLDCFLVINEYYEGCKYVNYYYTCEIVSKGEQHLTDEETKRGLVAEWIEPEKMIDIYKEYSQYAVTNEEKRGAYQREYTALTEYSAQI